MKSEGTVVPRENNTCVLLKAANDERLSTNEELQGSIEEMTTSKEEMQSLHEEMQTVNQELLKATEIATLFLDGELNARRFTANTNKIISLIPSDVARSITDLHISHDGYGTGRAACPTAPMTTRLIAL